MTISWVKEPYQITVAHWGRLVGHALLQCSQEPKAYGEVSKICLQPLPAISTFLSKTDLVSVPFPKAVR